MKLVGRARRYTPVAVGILVICSGLVALTSGAVATPSPLAPIAGIHAGGNHSCALLTNGTVRCWGSRSNGTVPSSSDTCGSSRQCTKTPLTEHTAIDALTNVVELSTGAAHSCVVRADATAWCWGDNQAGALGIGTTQSFPYAVEVLNPAGTAPLTGVAHVYAGGAQTCVVMTDKTANCWGSGLRDAAGDNAVLPIAVKNANGTPMTNILEMRIGGYVQCALLTDHTARCWGQNSNGMLGIGTLTDSSAPVTVKNPAGTGPLTGIADLTLSYADANICALLTNGTADCWGLNDFGQLGIGNTTGPQPCFSNVPCSALPMQVKTSDGTGILSGIADIQARFDDVCARMTNGTVDCWGGNGAGTLGDGTTTTRSLPVAVRDIAGTGVLQNVTQLGAGQYHACAVLADQSAVCWGVDIYSQLGDGTTTTSSLPVVVQDGGVPVLPVPNAPTGVSAVAGLHQATISWTPSVDNGTPIEGYAITASPGGQAITANAAATSWDLTQLTAGVAYTFTVRAVSADGDSIASAPSSPVVVIGPPGVPTSPTAVTGNASVLVSWTPPSNPGSSPISGYNVTPYLGATAQPTQTFGAGTTSATINGLPNGSLFGFHVAAVNAEGPGLDSDPSNVLVIGVPAALTATPTVVDGNGRVTVSWHAPAANGAPINGYIVTPYRAGVMQSDRMFNSAATTEVITGLVNGVSYTFRVAARNSYGQGAEILSSTAIVVGLPPRPPTKVKAVKSAKGSLRVAFTEAVNDSTKITKFTATCKSSNGGVARSKAGSAAPLVVTKLTPAKIYKCTVTATNSRGTSGASAPSAAVKP